jgi:hypothetical protein
METWSKENLAEEKYIGQMMALDGGLLDQLRDSRAFKTTQNWGLFRRPATLIRQETIKVARDMQDIEGANGANKIVKHLVIGERASGKSILVLQAMSMAYMKQWIVLNIPEGKSVALFDHNFVLTIVCSPRTRQQHVLLRTSPPRRSRRGANVHPAPSHPTPPPARYSLE